jgi:uncharacterized protein YigA (DUF484 family)
MDKNLAVRYAEAVDSIDAHRQTIAALNEKIVGLESVLADNELLQAKVTELETKIVDVTSLHDLAMADALAKVEAITAEKVTLAAELESVKGKLAMSPAHIDVAGRAALKDEAEGRDTMSYEQAQAEYAKITDPKARAEFRAAHAAELQLK